MFERRLVFLIAPVFFCSGQPALRGRSVRRVRTAWQHGCPAMPHPGLHGGARDSNGMEGGAIGEDHPALDFFRATLPVIIDSSSPSAENTEWVFRRFSDIIGQRYQTARLFPSPSAATGGRGIP
ncbi:hypothetical protein AVEN_113216-1 [Araneus ventricosus]|uniref:Uncharacterized protein n=1 Tax=Araneus ventricosus TaxID=182803 RepID=A0A4Y2WXJ8_ARAVE|nr:hypothetical protein AVEN_113216-1 [Araneus ventricosus]